DVVLRYVRAYTWVLLGAILLADRTGDLIPVHLLRLIGDSAVASTFSWGSAVLAWLSKAMGRAAFFTAGSQRGTGDLGGFTLLVQLWALERFPIIADRYVASGDPPEADTVPRGVRWMSVIRRHQHRVAMKLEKIRYALDRNTEFVVRNLNLIAPVHDWGARYREYLRLWEQRDQHIAEGEVRADPLIHHFHDEYDELYRRRTRLAISHDGAQIH
ncbi:Protein MAIN-LIKE 2, partial [Linum perenne]